MLRAESAEVLVVGAGVIGLSVSYHLVRQGMRVTMLDKGGVGCGATEKAGGMLAPLEEAQEDGPWLSLAMESFRMFPQLIEELRDATGLPLALLNDGFLTPALSEAQALELQVRLSWQQKYDIPLTWLDGSEALAHESRLPPDSFGALLTGERAVDPVLFCHAMRQAMGEKLMLREGAKVTSFLYDTTREVGERRVTGVVTEAGDTFLADKVVFAMGAWGKELLSEVGYELPIRPVRGQILFYEQPARPFRHVMWGRGYLIPRNNMFLMGATMEEAGFQEQTTSSARALLHEYACELIPSLADVTPVSHFAGFRPTLPDLLPVVGQVPGFSNAWIATGHYRNGILLSPITGKLIAESICAGSESPIVDLVSPTRFTNSLHAST